MSMLCCAAPESDLPCSHIVSDSAAISFRHSHVQTQTKLVSNLLNLCFILLIHEKRISQRGYNIALQTGQHYFAKDASYSVHFCSKPDRKRIMATHMLEPILQWVVQLQCSLRDCCLGCDDCKCAQLCCLLLTGKVRLLAVW